MFYNIIVDPTHKRFSEFLLNHVSGTSSGSSLLRKSEFIYSNQSQTIFIFHIDADFGDSQIQEEVMELFNIIPGVVRNLNVLNVNFTLEDICDYLDDISLLEEKFALYL